MVKSAFTFAGESCASKCLVVGWTEKIDDRGCRRGCDGARKEAHRDVLCWILTKREVKTLNCNGCWIGITVQTVDHGNQHENEQHEDHYYFLTIKKYG